VGCGEKNNLRDWVGAYILVSGLFETLFTEELPFLPDVQRVCDYCDKTIWCFQGLGVDNEEVGAL
jgi:hypothetical protein